MKSEIQAANERRIAFNRARGLTDINAAIMLHEILSIPTSEIAQVKEEHKDAGLGTHEHKLYLVADAILKALRL